MRYIHCSDFQYRKNDVIWVESDEYQGKRILIMISVIPNKHTGYDTVDGIIMDSLGRKFNEKVEEKFQNGKKYCKEREKAYILKNYANYFVNLPFPIPPTTLVIEDYSLIKEQFRWKDFPNDQVISLEKKFRIRYPKITPEEMNVVREKMNAIQVIGQPTTNSTNQIKEILKMELAKRVHLPKGKLDKLREIPWVKTDEDSLKFESHDPKLVSVVTLEIVMLVANKPDLEPLLTDMKKRSSIKAIICKQALLDSLCDKQAIGIYSFFTPKISVTAPSHTPANHQVKNTSRQTPNQARIKKIYLPDAVHSPHQLICCTFQHLVGKQRILWRLDNRPGFIFNMSTPESTQPLIDTIIRDINQNMELNGDEKKHYCEELTKNLTKIDTQNLEVKVTKLVCSYKLLRTLYGTPVLNYLEDSKHPIPPLEKSETKLRSFEDFRDAHLLELMSKIKTVLNTQALVGFLTKLENLDGENNDSLLMELQLNAKQGITRELLDDAAIAIQSLRQYMRGNIQRVGQEFLVTEQHVAIETFHLIQVHKRGNVPNPKSNSPNFPFFTKSDAATKTDVDFPSLKRPILTYYGPAKKQRTLQEQPPAAENTSPFPPPESSDSFNFQF